MGCDYPCHICDPEEWVEESKLPPYDFNKAYERAETSFDKSFDKDAALMWWVPMEGWPVDVTITNEREYDDVWVTPSRPVKLLASDRTYMEKPVAAWGGGVERFRIISYMQRVLDWDKDLAYISAVLSQTPPPWGWWMPTLNP